MEWFTYLTQKAGLFSAVVTAFIIESYKMLQKDPSVDILARILKQLESTAINQPALQSSVQSSLTDNPWPTSANVRINILWFLSLIFSLATVLVGIVSLQWLREHQRPHGDLEPQIAFALHHMHNEALERWYFPQIFTILPLLLQVGLVLFLIGVNDFLWNLNHGVALPVSIAIGFTLSFLVATTILPTLQNLLVFLPRFRTSKKPRAPCPYKSPQSWAFHRLVSSIVHPIMRWTKAQLDESGEMNPHNLLGMENRKPWYSTFPKVTGFVFRGKSGDSWLEHEAAWLFQRDYDGMAIVQDIKKTRPRERPVPLYDTVKGLLKSKERISPEVQRSVIPADHCIEQIFHSDIFDCSPKNPYPFFLHRLVPSQSSYSLPRGIEDPSPTALKDHALFHFFSRKDPFNNTPRALKRRGVEICIRLTEWMFGTREVRRFVPDETPIAPNLPIQWVARQLDENFTELQG